MSFAFVAVGPLSESPFLAFPLSEARHARGGLRRRLESETRKQWRKLINSSVVFYGKKQWGATIYPWTMKAGVVSGADLQPSGKALYTPHMWIRNLEVDSWTTQVWAVGVNWKNICLWVDPQSSSLCCLRVNCILQTWWVPELRVLNPLSHKTFQHLCDLASLNPFLQVRKQA